MEATVEILKGIFLKGPVTENIIILFPLSIIEIIFYFFYFILKKINIEFMLTYILYILITVIIALNICYIVFGGQIIITKKTWRFKTCSMFILLILTYPIYAEFQEIQSGVALLKIMLVIAWVTETVKEYITFDVDKFFNRNMIVMFTMICIILKLDINYMLLIILLLLMTVNLLNTSKIK